MTRIVSFLPAGTEIVHALGAGDRFVIGRDHRVRAEPLERLLDGAQIAHSVVEDRYPRSVAFPVAHKTPFVEGTPVSDSSTATASRNARANALKHASILWWAFDPSSA